MGSTVSSLLFQPPLPSKLKEHKIVWLKTANGSRIPGFYIAHRSNFPGPDICMSLSAGDIKHSDPEKGITILYSHANAEDLGSIYPWCKFLSKMLKVNLFAYDYTGYGMAMDQGTYRTHARSWRSSAVATPTFSHSLPRTQANLRKITAMPISTLPTITCDMNSESQHRTLSFTAAH